MRSRTILLASGVVLVAPLVYILVQEFAVLRQSDVVEATRPLADVPIDALTAGTPVTLDVTIPSGNSWERLRKSFGWAAFLIVAVDAPLEAGARPHRTYLSAELPLQITVTSTAGALKTVATNHTPFGYSSEEGSSARSFEALAGERLQLRLVAGSHSPLEGRVVVVADWPSGAIASARDGFGFLEVIRWLAVAAALAGAACLYAALRRSRPAPASD
jgi:hypothetical protein